jgi:hypothetical protein
MADSKKIEVSDKKNQNNKDNQDYYQEETTLPRSGWVSKKAYLIAILKAKRALDKIEKEAFG